MPELKRLKLRRNNWDCEMFQFDEILNETASQKRVYEVVAKPVVEAQVKLSPLASLGRKMLPTVESWSEPWRIFLQIHLLSKVQ
ncbi:hypothetical protein GOP47_0002795 [Adiantum capillus-veneris]|uniref:Uncharacterized protein n=1 Tax=Adiantum capillus-veneris TaxID=13818 RepID=A0A9D4VCR2_ADICA|nr:hypothetical protein GOP47_0002795 [Adiantum capillus-veneris]